MMQGNRATCGRPDREGVSVLFYFRGTGMNRVHQPPQREDDSQKTQLTTT